jgi:hypothetical protein
MRPHEKLDVWKKSIEFVVLVYRATDDFPRDERFGLISQLRRAAVRSPQILVLDVDRIKSLPIFFRRLRVRPARLKPNF